MGGYAPLGNGIQPGGLYLPSIVGHYASTPSHSGLDITGDIDIRLRANFFTLPGQHILASKFLSANNQRSWLLRKIDGALQFHWYTNGSTSSGVHVSDALTSTNGWFRVTLDVDDGNGNFAVDFYVAPDSPDMPTAWEHKGTSQGVGPTSIFASTAQVAISNDNGGFSGSFASLAVRRFQLRNGIDGAIVADPVFVAPATPWTIDKTTAHDGYRLWTINGARWEWRA